jgi:hypothetical protein
MMKNRISGRGDFASPRGDFPVFGKLPFESGAALQGLFRVGGNLVQALNIIPFPPQNHPFPCLFSHVN